LLFRSKEHAREWRAQTGMPAGELLPYEQVWELSKLWYGNRMMPDYSGRSAAEVQAIFNRLGLRSEFWSVHTPD
jgi:hypothetical protein